MLNPHCFYWRRLHANSFFFFSQLDKKHLLPHFIKILTDCHKRQSLLIEDSATTGLGRGVLTPAALRYGPYQFSSADDKNARTPPGRRGSKFQGQGSSVTNKDTKDIFVKHDVVPMPMHSDYFPSEKTRASILTELDEEPKPYEIPCAESGLPQINTPSSDFTEASRRKRGANGSCVL